MSLFERIFVLILCHFIGDYVLQIDFLAKTKGTNWYHLFIHSVLYSLPFYLIFGMQYIPLLVGMHFVVDVMKARYHLIGYVTDQVLHFLILVPLYLLPYIN